MLNTKPNSEKKHPLPKNKERKKDHEERKGEKFKYQLLGLDGGGNNKLVETRARQFLTKCLGSQKELRSI